jgi:nucleoside-diphosphate-sugar epimerase
MSSILVTGAAGTVGSVVAGTLGGARGMVRRDPRPDQIVGDLTDPASLAAAVAGTRAVVHCAASLSKDWADCERTNVEGTRHLIAAMRSAGCERLIHLSTVSVYDYRGGHRLDEECPIWTERVDAYGYTKAEADRLVAASGLAFTILRLVVVLSMHPRSYWGPLAIERARVADAPVWPLAKLPHVHVDNIAAAVGLALARDVAIGRTYNVMDGFGDGRAFNERLFAAAGREVPPGPSLPIDLPVEAARIRDELGYAPVDRFTELLAALD